MSEQRLIDANALDSALLTEGLASALIGYPHRRTLTVGEIRGILQKSPTVPAEVVCHCRNCKFCKCDEISKTGRCTCPNRDIFANDTEAFEAVTFDDYCSYGERRESEVEK